MCRLSWSLALLLLLIPTTSRAIQLHWISGETNINFTEATRCTLVVQADSVEVTLPSEWRLLWFADTLVRIVALDSLEVCAADTASVYDAPMQFRHASEYLQINTHEYLSAWDRKLPLQVDSRC
jgi:hypothetical protein